ncbi:MAG: hypothetical protein Q8S19_08830, partial [Bacillota bacterium]|nr:hypothetical protein [Bacillota bacterium]
MRPRREGVDAIWEATERRSKVLAQHPELERLEQVVAEALVRCMQGRLPWSEVDQARAARDLFLTQNKIPLGYAEPRYRCSLCQDEGYIDGKMCSCKKQEQLSRLFSGSGLPQLLKSENFDRYDLKWYSPVRKTPIGITEREAADEARKACMQFVASSAEGRKPRGLYLYGKAGLG